MSSNKTITVYIASLYFYQYIFQLTLCFFSLCSQTSLLFTIYKTKLWKQLSVNLILNMVAWCIATSSIIIQTALMGRFGQSNGFVFLISTWSSLLILEVYISGPLAFYSAVAQFAAQCTVTFSGNLLFYCLPRKNCIQTSQLKNEKITNEKKKAIFKLENFGKLQISTDRQNKIKITTSSFSLSHYCRTHSFIELSDWTCSMDSTVHVARNLQSNWWISRHLCCLLLDWISNSRIDK
jgi:hypothetical protein